MQEVLAFLIFALAAGYLLKKFLWNPIVETFQKSNGNGTLDGGKTKCGNKDCGCH